jgi:small subunit ribosomal protein S16
MDKRQARDSRVIEELGFYDPLAPEVHNQLTIKSDRVAYWISVGAQPSDTVRQLLKKHGKEADSSPS